MKILLVLMVFSADGSQSVAQRERPSLEVCWADAAAAIEATQHKLSPAITALSAACVVTLEGRPS